MEFEDIVRRYQKQLYVVAYHYLQNQHDAEDTVQEVFLRLLTLEKAFESDEHLKYWLIRTTINRCKSQLRAPWRRRSAPLDEAMGLVSAPQDRNREVREAVLALPQKYREVVILYYYADYSCAEIADLLHRRTTTVQTQLQRARGLLRETLKEAFDDEPT